MNSPDPMKNCQACGAPLIRKRFGERLEGLAEFARRPYCNRACMAKGMVKPRVVPPERLCKRCGETKPADAFGRLASAVDGLRFTCRACDSAMARRWQRNHPDAVKSNDVRYRQENREQILAKSRARYQANPAKAAAWYVAWKASNPGVGSVRAAAWARANPEKVQRNRFIRSARARNARGVASSAQIAARVAFYGWSCWMCGGPYEHLDHVIPLARGGTNWPANLRPACKPCNLKKGARRSGFSGGTHSVSGCEQEASA